MSPLLAPIFAQLVTLQVVDRTEARYVGYDEEQQFEGSTTPGAQLSATVRRADFSVGYAPTLTLAPLEKKPRELFVFHDAGASAGYRWKRTRLTLSSTLGAGEVNFRLAALRGPGGVVSLDGDTTDTTAPTDVEPGAEPNQPSQPAPNMPGLPQPGEPTTGDASTGQLVIVDRTVRYYVSTTSLELRHDPIRNVTLGLMGGHTRAGGLNDESLRFYPELSGWFVGGSGTYTYPLTSRDTFVSDGSLMQTWSSNGNRTATLNAQETYQHIFSRRTFSALGAGINITRFSEDSGLAGFSVFPTFRAALAHQVPLRHAGLSLALYAYSSPALDPLRALVDPRLGVGASAGYTRRDFSVSLSGATAQSLAPEDHNTGAIDSYEAEGRIAYRIAELVEVDGGGRYVRQQVQDVTVLPSSWAVYVGVNAGYVVQLYRGR